MKRICFDKVNTNPTMGLPMMPSTWIGGAEYIPTTRMQLTFGGGIGGGCRYEYVHKIDRIPTNEMFKVKRVVDGKVIYINTLYVVVAEDFDIMHKQFDNRNTNFETGICDLYVLTERGHKFRFINQFESM